MRLCLGIFALWLVPTVAQASNGGHPRTPVDWSEIDVACQSIVDRSVDPVWQLEYGIPFEDTDVTADEVADSRRHQFFALCRQLPPDKHLPNWITQADIEAAAAKDLVDPATVPPTDVLETDPDWQGCFHRLNADDDRRPITYAAAEAGVAWDTTDVPAGTYTLVGYTYEPALNLWTRRPGIVKITDGEDSATLGPSAAISTGELILRAGEVAVLEGCVDALPGSTLTASYASTQTEAGAAWTPQWVPFSVDQPVEGNAFAIEFPAPDEIAGYSAAIRVEVRDPEDRTYVTYMLDLIVVLPRMSDGDACEGNAFVADPSCATDSGTDMAGTDGAGPATGTTTGPSSAGQDDAGGGGGCQCAASRPGAERWLLLALPVLAMRRRRRT